MEVYFFVPLLTLVQTVQTLDITVSGQAYIEPGIPYEVSCTVNEYNDNRLYLFSAETSPSVFVQLTVWFYKPYGCFKKENGTSNCTTDSCSCDDSGLTAHWIFTLASDVNTAVTFSCSSSNNLSIIIPSQPVTAVIARGPGSSLMFNPSNESVIKVLGEELSVVCLAVCIPTCSFQWTKLTSVVSNSDILHIQQLSKDDHGTYKCTAENGYGKDGTKMFNLTVNYGPNRVSLLPNDTEYTVKVGNTVSSINCSADCRPTCNYAWIGPNVPVGTTNILSLQNIQKDQNGYFNCTASNIEGSSKSSNINLNVQFGPGTSLQIDPSATSVVKNKGDTLGPINCKATCNPPCQYMWKKPDNSIINNGELSITSLSIADHGTFICTASNNIGDSQHINLDVTVNYGPQSVTLLPNDTHYTVTEGNKIPPITCTADCRPDCNYTWSGSNVPAGTINILNIQNIQKNQRGVFNCTALNIAGSLKSSNVNVNVHFGPGFSLNIGPSDNPVIKTKGEKLGPFECTATCNPPCQYTWTKPNKTIIRDGELTIKSLSIEDHGLFICTASNGIGDSKNKTLDVTVNYGPVVVLLSPPTTHYNVTFQQNVSTIKCTAKCRPECEYMWTGPNVPPGTVNVLNLQNVQKNQRGDFNCNASNVVGSKQSFSVNVNVQYKPEVNEITINGSNFTVRENTTVVLTCSFEGNPAPQNSWVKNRRILSKAADKNRPSVITIQPAQCDDSGSYSCVANNSLGFSSAQQSLFVTCSPRLNYDLEQPSTQIGLPKGADLNLTVYLISYPTPTSTLWFFKSEDRNETHIPSNLDTYESFKHVAFLTKANLTQFDFGDYILKVRNDVGTLVHAYHVVPQGPPDPTSLLNVTCGVTTAQLYWKTLFNGGETQNFSIIVKNNKNEMYIHDTKINDDVGNTIKFVSIKLSAGIYSFRIYGKNSYGNKNSTNEMGCQVNDENGSKSSSVIGAAAGGGTAAAILVLVMVVLFVFIKKRRNAPGDDGRRSLTTEDKDDDDGLKDNPLYLSSGEASIDNGPVYSVVNKNVTSNVKDIPRRLEQGPVYSEVKKAEAKGKLRTNKKNIKKADKSGNAEKDLEMGSVYENAKNLIRTNEHNEVYANAVHTATENSIYRPTKNKDGLIYADLDLAPCGAGNKFVIRGIENRSNYAVIDLTKTAEPLPSDEDEDGEKSNQIVQEKSEDNK